MLYKKYIIEVNYNIQIVERIELNSNSNGNDNVNLSFRTIPNQVSIIKYADNYGIVTSYPYIFNSYSEAFEVLSTQYYNIRYNNEVLSIGIKEIYNDIEPPLEVLRSMKIKQILK